MNPETRLRVLSLSTVYPSSDRPAAGLFVQARLSALGALAEVRVVAPAPLWNYHRPATAQSEPAFEAGRLQVLRPRWAYPPGGGVMNPLLLAMQLRPVFERLRGEFAFQVIDAHFGYPEGVAAARLAESFGVPFSVTLRGSELSHARHRARRAALRWALRRASCVVALSEELRDLALSLGAPAGRCRVIPNGVDAKRFYPRDRLAMRLRHGLPAEKRLLLSAGHLIPLKGHDRVLRACGDLNRAGLPVELLIAGDGGAAGNQYESTLRRQATDLFDPAAVRFLGSVPPDTLAELMSAADLFCMASAREGWPNVVHEALACGTPVVATRVGATAALMPSARYGIVVPPGDDGALAAALRAALASEWDRDLISRWAHSRSWEVAASEVAALLEAAVRTASRYTAA